MKSFINKIVKKFKIEKILHSNKNNINIKKHIVQLVLSLIKNEINILKLHFNI